jgi:hypothetical protein
LEVAIMPIEYFDVKLDGKKGVEDRRAVDVGSLLDFMRQMEEFGGYWEGALAQNWLVLKKNLFDILNEQQESEVKKK